MKIKVRKVSITDIPQLVDQMDKFYNVLVEKGAKDISPKADVIRGGAIIEVGFVFNNTEHSKCIVAVDVESNKLIGFIIGLLEFCGPVEQYLKRVRIHGIYIENDTLAAPKILSAMWNELESWAQQIGAEYFYANIHPGNQSSVRIAKNVGFKHHYTQFFRPIKLTPLDEEV